MHSFIVRLLSFVFLVALEAFSVFYIKRNVCVSRSRTMDEEGSLFSTHRLDRDPDRPEEWSPGAQIRITFTTTRQIDHADIDCELSDYYGAHIMLIPRLRRNPLILNEISRYFRNINEKMDFKVSPALRKLARNRHYMYYKELDMIEKEYNELLLDEIMTNGLKIKRPTKPSLLANIYLRSHAKEAFAGNIRNVNSQDLILGKLLESETSKIQLSNGHWKLKIEEYEMPRSITRWCPEFIEAEAVLAKKGPRGYYKVLGKSDQVFRITGQQPFFLPNDYQFFDYGFEVRYLPRFLFFDVQIPSYLSIDRVARPWISYNSKGFSGNYVDVLKMKHFHQDSLYHNWLVFIPGANSFNMAINITVIENVQHEQFSIDIDLMVTEKNSGLSPNHDKMETTSVDKDAIIWKFKILQLFNPISVLPGWITRALTSVRVIYEVGKVEISFHYPENELIPLETREDLETHGAVHEDSCLICWGDFKFREENASTKDNDSHDSDDEVYDLHSQMPFKFPLCPHIGHYHCLTQSLLLREAKDVCPVCGKRQNIMRPDLD